MPAKPQKPAKIAIHCAHDRLVAVTELIPNPKNPNQHSDKQIAMLAKIIQSTGWRAPIVVSKRSGFVVAGHGRLEAARLLGVRTVPVNVQDFATEVDEWARMVADNRPAAELIVTTLGFNRRDIACLIELQQRGEIQSLGLVCSNFFAEKDMGAYTYAQQEFAKTGARMATSRNHSKLLLFDFGGTKYTVESSANLRSCNNFEQFCLTCDPALHAFHRNWVTRMLK